MDLKSLYEWLFWALLLTAGLVWVALHFINAPYGRFHRNGWGPAIPARVAWILMEAPAALTMPILWLLSPRTSDPVSILFLGIWESHYFYRAFIFPFRGRGVRRPMPVSVMGMGALFNVWNGFLLGAWLFFLGPARELAWGGGALFIFGVCLFCIGMAVNHHSDAVLRGLRSEGESGYKIPFGGLYQWVSVPSYFGEILQWIGFAVLTWSPPGALFAVFTAANLLPRAVATHKWYLQQFADYPRERKAVIPYIL